MSSNDVQMDRNEGETIYSVSDRGGYTGGKTIYSDGRAHDGSAEVVATLPRD